MKRSYKLAVGGVLLFVVALNLGLLNTKNDSSSSTASNSVQASHSTQVSSAHSTRIAVQTDSRIALKKYLKDPDAAEIRNHNGNCGEVNSKNSFGGYTGFKRFIASSAIVAIEGENMETDEFQKAWDQVCK